MPWIPGYQAYFNVGLSHKIPFALGAPVVARAEYEGQVHPGLYQEHSGSAFTESMLVRPRLQNFAVNNPVFTRDVVNVPEV